MITLGASVALLAGVAATATAQETVGAECVPPRASYLQNGTANDRFAITFISGQTGTLTRAEIDYEEPAGHQFPLRVQILPVDPSTNAPTDAVLAETSVGDPLPGPTTLVAIFAAPVEVTAGESYALAISRSGAGPNAFGWGYSSDPTACQDKFFYQTGGTGQWNGSINFDMIFRIFVTVAQPEGGQADGTLTIDANKGKVEKGRKVTLSGQYDVPTNEACEPSRTVELQRRKKSEPETAFETFETVQTNGVGNFSTREKVRKTYVYRAVVQETDTCDDESSNSQKVRVQKKKAAQEA